MKPKRTLRNLLAIASSSLLAVSSASATTFTWTQTATGSQDWTVDGNWDGSLEFVSSSGNELAFLTSLALASGTAITVTNVPATLSMNVLTLAGAGPNSTLGSSITIGDNTSTWTIGDGTTSTVNLTSTLGGGTSDRDIRYTIPANLTLNQTTTLFTGGSTSGTGAVFSGNITGAAGFGITKSGSHLLIFSGNNSYTGTTLVSAGTLRLNSATALSGGLGATGGTSALTISGTGVVELGAGNFQRNLGTGSDQFQITGGTSGFSAIGGPRVITVNNDASQELTWGSTSFAPSTLVLNAATANNTLELTNKIDLGAVRTVAVNANKALLSGVIRNGGLFKSGNGTLVLTGTNTYEGNTTLSGGSLSVGAANNIGSGGELRLFGGTLQITGTALTSMTGFGGGHNVVFSTNNVGFDIHHAAHTFTVDKDMNIGNKAFTKLGAGTLVLNQDNTIGGGAASTTSVSGGGTLVLDYSTNNGSKLADTSGAVTLGGTNLILRGGSHAEVVASIVLTANTGNSISRDGGSSATLANAGVLTTNTLSNLNIAEAGIVSTTSANVNGIQTLGRVTVGSDFAAKDGGNLLQAYGSYTAYTAGSGAGSVLTVVNQLNGGGTMTSDLLSYSLRIANSGASDVLNLNSGVDLRVSNGGTILYAGGSDNNYTINGDGFLGSNSGNQAFNVNVFTGTLTVNARLTSGGSSPLAKFGAGTLVAGGASSYTGATYVQQGTLLVNNTTGSGTGTGTVNVQSNATLGGTGTIDGNTIINPWGKLTFNLSTDPGSHDKLEIATGKTLTFSDDSVLTITSAGGATAGLYTLVTAAGGISGSAPSTVNLPLGWTADAPQIVGNDLQINITSTGSGGSAYDIWKAANAPGSNPDDDTDGDGVPNAVEFVLGGTSATNDLAKLPQVAANGTNMTVTFKRKQSSIDPKTSVAIEVGTDLAIWNTSPSPYTVPDGAIAGPPVKVEKGVPADYDTVTLTVAQDSARKFARLKVIITP